MALRFGDHFWGDGGYEAIETKLGEAQRSFSALAAFFADLAQAESKHAAKLEKLLKKHAPHVNELPTIQAVWDEVSGDLNKQVEMTNLRVNHLRNDVWAKIQNVAQETSQSKRNAMAEAQKQLKDYRALMDALAKARDHYVKCSVKARDSAEQLKQMIAANEKPSKIKPKEKEVGSSEAAAKAADLAYKEAVGKVTSFIPSWINKMQALYNEVQTHEESRMLHVVQSTIAYLEATRPFENFFKDSELNIMAHIKKVDVEKDMNGWISGNRKDTEPPPLPQYYAYDAPEPAPLKSSPSATSTTSTTETTSATVSATAQTPHQDSSNSLNITASSSSTPETGAAASGGPPKRMPPAMPGKPEGGGGWNVRPTMKEQSMRATLMPEDEEEKPAATPTSPRLPPGARSLFGPVTPQPRNPPLNKNGSGGPGGQGQNGPAPQGRATIRRGGRGGPAPGPGGAQPGRGGSVRGRGGPAPRGGRGGTAPQGSAPTSAGSAPTGAPSGAGRGATSNPSNVRVKGDERVRTESTGTFFKELQASVDDFGDIDALIGDINPMLDSVNETPDATVAFPSLDDILDSPPPDDQGDRDFNPNVGTYADYIGWAMAMFDYEAGDSDELSFKEGDMIHLLAKDDSGWWSGECNGVAGLFPANYVEEMK